MIIKDDINYLTERSWFYRLVYFHFFLISMLVVRKNDKSQPSPKPLPGDLAWVWAVLLPMALFSSTWLVFHGAAQWAGKETGYLFGFLFYWLVWCILVPRALLGKTEFATILSDRVPLFSSPNWPAALLWLAVTLIAIFMYAEEFVRTPLALILIAVPLATFNGICEEILWRGLYVRWFPHNPWLAILYPSLGFALWHLAPQVVFPAENVIAFVISTFFLALPYGYIAYRTGSAKWTAISHSLSGILALSGYLAPSLLALIGEN